MIWHVSSKAGSDTNDGRAEATPFKSVQHAFEAAKPGDTIVIAPGLYAQDLPTQIATIRAADVTVTVLGSD